MSDSIFLQASGYAPEHKCRVWIIFAHLVEIEDWLLSAPVRKHRTKNGPGALRLAGLP